MWIRGSILDSWWSSAGAKVFGVDRRIYPNLTTLGIRVNEAAQEIIFRSVTAGVEGSEELILTLRTEPLRCEIHRREVSSMLQQSKRPDEAQRRGRSMAEAHSGLSCEMEQSAGRCTDDESTFHIAERIPEGTK